MYLDRDVIAVVGPDGSGKSSFGRLLAEEIDASEVTIPGYHGDAPKPLRIAGSFFDDVLASIGHRTGTKGLVKWSYIANVLLYAPLSSHERGKGRRRIVQRHPAIDGPVYWIAKYNGFVDEGVDEEMMDLATDKIYKYVTEMPGTVICVLPPSTEESYRRVVERDEHTTSSRDILRRIFRGNVLEMHENPEDLRRATEVYGKVLPYLQERFGINVIYTTSDRTPEEMVRGVVGREDFQEALATASQYEILNSVV